MIPKIIHYCWFGKGKQSKMIKQCINSWKIHLSDYQFILWNEENFQSNSEFYNYAYEHKKWAHVSDYVRLKVLYEYGGVYLDTDMYFIKPLDESLLSYSSFFGAEDHNLISCGIIGCHHKNDFIKDSIEYYESLENVEKEGFKMPITKIMTNIFRNKYRFHEVFDKNYFFDTVAVFKTDYFYPYPFNINKRLDKNFLKYATSNTYAIHLWNGSWHNYNEFHYFRRRQYFKGLIKMIKNIFNNKIIDREYYKKVYVAIKKSIK